MLCGSLTTNFPRADRIGYGRSISLGFVGEKFGNERNHVRETLQSDIGLILGGEPATAPFFHGFAVVGGPGRKRDHDEVGDSQPDKSHDRGSGEWVKAIRET